MRVSGETLHVQDRRADAETQVLRRERVGRHGSHFLVVSSAVESQLVECGDDGVAAQATGRELLSELFGDIGGHQGHRLVVDKPHPADGQHLRTELGPLAVEEVGGGGDLELEQPYRCVGRNATRVVDDGGDLPGGNGSYDFVAGKGAATAPSYDTALRG